MLSGGWAISKLTAAKLDGNSVDDSYGSLVALADAKWFTTLLANHNDPDCDFHLDMYEQFIIGKDLERVIEQDKQVGVRKAKAMRIEGPVMLAVASLLSIANTCNCRVGG